MRTWTGLNIEAEGSGISGPLSYQVNLLGALLGQVIREQAGKEVFDLVEDLRNRCKALENGPEGAGYEPVEEILAGLSLDRLFWLIRSYTAFFNLVNEAERQEIIRINREAERDETLETARDAVDRDEGSVGAYIVSMTHTGREAPGADRQRNPRHHSRHRVRPGLQPGDDRHDVGHRGPVHDCLS